LRSKLSQKKTPSAREKDKEIVIENPQLELVKLESKKQKVEKVSKEERDVDATVTPQIQPSTFYPPRA
jgi:NACalpha-BTF3-like transcription factor